MEENLTNEPTQPSDSFEVPDTSQSAGILLLEDAQAYLLTAGKWARFLGIIGFIGTAFIAILSLFIGTIMSTLSHFSPTGQAIAPTGFLTVFYLLIAVFHFFVSLYLYQFGEKVKQGISFSNSVSVTEGLGKLKSLFKLLGITTIVIMILYVFLIIGTIIFASKMMHAPSTY